MRLFSVENLSDINGVIQNFDLTINPGEVCYIICENGIGKVLFEILCGYKLPSCGNIYLEQKKWLELNEDARCILNRNTFGIASVTLPLINEMTIEENIAISGLLDGDTGNPLETARIFHIEHLLKKYPLDLTYMERLRCICARAFYNQKRIVVVHDIFIKLHEKSELSLILYKTAKALNVAVICINEDNEYSYAICDILYKYLPAKKSFSILDYRM